MAQQKLTIKSFLNKAHKSVLTPAKFLAHQRDALLASEFGSIAEPFIAKLENGECLPSEALSELSKVLFISMQRSEIEKAELSLSRSNTNTRTGHALTSDFVGTVYDHDGNVVSVTNAKEELVDLIKGFDNPNDAGSWCARRLFECSPSCYGEVSHTKVLINGAPLTTRISSVAACKAQLSGTGRHPIMSKGFAKSSALTSKMRVRSGKTSHFSRG